MLPSLDDIRALPDFAPQYKWELTFMQGPLISPDIQALNFRCISSTLPKKRNQGSAVNIRGHQKRFSTISTYDSITLTFIETIDNTISNFFTSLAEATWAANTGLQVPQQQLESVIRLTRMDREANPIRVYQLFGAWMAEYDPGGNLVAGTEGDVFRPTMGFVYDYFREGSPFLI